MAQAIIAAATNEDASCAVAVKESRNSLAPEMMPAAIIETTIAIWTSAKRVKTASSAGWNQRCNTTRLHSRDSRSRILK